MVVVFCVSNIVSGHLLNYLLCILLTFIPGILGTRLVSGNDEDAHIEDAVAVVSLAVSQLHQQQVNLTAPPSTCNEVTRWDSGMKILRYIDNSDYMFKRQ